MRQFEEIRIENTNLCPLNCIMCPRDKMTRPKGRMTLDTFVSVCNSINDYISSPTVRIFDVHGFGEPLTDKEILTKIRFVKDSYPNVKIRMVTTLYVASEKMIDSLLVSGLDYIIISHYGASESDYRIIHGGTAYARVRQNIEYLVKKNSKLGNPVNIVFENLDLSNVLPIDIEHARKLSLKLWLENLKGYGMKIHNETAPHNWGSAYPFRKISSSTCSVVSGFRSRVLQVTWNGDVIPCCFDYNADVAFGNLLVDDLESIFSSEKYRCFIARHKENDISGYPPCKFCHRCLIP